MAEKIAIKRLTQANVYLNKTTLLGRVAELELPDIKPKQLEHKALGMIGDLEFPSGFEKLEGKLKWASIEPDVLVEVFNPFKAAQLMVRSSLESFTNLGRVGEDPVTIYLDVMFKIAQTPKLKPNENTEMESEFNAMYMKQVIGGKDIFEIDMLTNTYKAGGVDLLATYRANLGG